MDIKSPKNWSKKEFQAFVMLMAASANLEIDPAERKMIKKKAGDSFHDVKQAFKTRNDAERIDAVLEAKDEHLKTPEDHEKLKKLVHEVFEADEDFSMIERGFESILKRLL